MPRVGKWSWSSQRPQQRQNYSESVDEHEPQAINAAREEHSSLLRVAEELQSARLLWSSLLGEKDNVVTEERRAARSEQAAAAECSRLKSIASDKANRLHELSVVLNHEAESEEQEKSRKCDRLCLRQEISARAGDVSKLRGKIIKEEEAAQAAHHHDETNDLRCKLEAVTTHRSDLCLQAKHFEIQARELQQTYFQRESEVATALSQINQGYEEIEMLEEKLHDLEESACDEEDMRKSIRPDPSARNPMNAAANMHEVWQLQAEKRQYDEQASELKQSMSLRNLTTTPTKQMEPRLRSVQSPSKTMDARSPQDKLAQLRSEAQARCHQPVCLAEIPHTPNGSTASNAKCESAYGFVSGQSSVRKSISTMVSPAQISKGSPASELVAENRRLRGEVDILRDTVRLARENKESFSQEELRANDPFGSVVNTSRARLRGALREELHSSRELLAEMRQSVEVAMEGVQRERQLREACEERLRRAELANGWTRIPQSWCGAPQMQPSQQRVHQPHLKRQNQDDGSSPLPSPPSSASSIS